MKKRMLSILLTLCMALSLLPTMALAGGVETEENYLVVSDWEGLQEAIKAIEETTADTAYKGIKVNTVNFGWPDEGGTLVIDFENDGKTTTGKSEAGNQYYIYLVGTDGSDGCTWTIPANVTLKCYERLYLGDSYGAVSTVTVNGKVEFMDQGTFGNNWYPHATATVTVNGTLNTSGTYSTSLTNVGLTVNNSGTLNVLYLCNLGEVSIAAGAAVNIGANTTISGSLTLADGVHLTGQTLSLQGDLTTPGSAVVENYVQIYHNSTSSETITLSGDLVLGTVQPHGNAPVLTIPAGSSVSLEGFYSASGVTVNVAGVLDITGGYSNFDSSTITIQSGGTVKMQPSVQFGSSTSESSIEGEGTLELYGILREWDDGTINCEFAPQIFGVSSRKTENGSYVPLTGVDSAVTVKRMWEICTAHSWSDTTTVAPTCGARGYDTATCSECGTEKRSNYVAPTYVHTPSYEAWASNPSKVTVECSVCGQIGGTITITATDGVYADGAEVKTATLNNVPEWVTAPEIVYTNNTEVTTDDAPATASATFGDVTIYTTFNIVACAHEGGEATCTERAICSKCGLAYGNLRPHTQGTAATCQHGAICSVCNQEYSAPASHTYVLAHNETMHWVECSVCGLECLEDYGLDVTSPSQISNEVLLEMIYAYLEQKGEQTQEQATYLERYGDTPSQHGYSSTSCTEAGTCLLCGYGKAAGSHIWNDGEVTTAPTCTEKGVRTYTCSSCSETKTEEIPAMGHTEVTIPGKTATCTEEGLTEGKKCSVCGTVTVEQTTIPVLAHTSTESDCTKQDICGVCGAVIRVAGNHIWGDWTVTKEATCTETGSRTRTCSLCNEVESETIPLEDHTEETIPAVAATCTETGLTAGVKCSVCGKILTAQETTDALGHDWGQWVVDKEATETEDGSQHRDCSRCDAVDTQTISKLPKQEVGWTIPDTITWTYGQVISAQNTAYNDTVDGGALTYSSSDESVATVDADGKAAIVGAGTATITATAAKVDGKYAATSASYTLIINKAPLTVTANDVAITYGQAPTNNGWTADGLKYNDTESAVNGTAAYTYTYEQYGNVGSYAINVSGLTTKNYDITFAPGILTVSKATDYTITLGNLTQRDDSITSVTASIAPQDATAQINVEYQVDGAWTTSLPTAAGEYRVRASLTSSGNIQPDGEYTTDTLTIQRSIVVDDTDVSVTVDGGKAEITVTEDELADIVNSAEGDVSINLGGVEGVDELVLPGSLLEALSESGKADSMTITTEDASISMSGAVLDTVASAITGEDTVAVKLTAVEEEDLTDLQQAALDSITQDAVIVEVSLVITHADGSPDTELHQLGGNVEVTVPYAGEVPAGKYIVVCYLSDDGNVTYVRATYNAETQQVTFTTNHFSNYAVFVSGDPAVVVDGGSGSGLYAEGATVTIKADSKSGYTFAGWEIVSGGITLTDSKAVETTFTMPAANVELIATYTKNSSGGGGGAVSTYTLTFDTNGGSKIDSVSKAGGTTISLTGYVPTRTGYDFGGWYSDAKLTDKITSVKLTKDMTVYAKWTEKGSENPFTDVADDAYYADAVIWAVGEGITSGTTATTFTPNDPCTRAQAVTFLWRAAGSPAPKSSVNPFADVKADAYYYDAVLWAVEQGITKGTSDTTFSPNANCTRAQVVTFLYRAIEE